MKANSYPYKEKAQRLFEIAESQGGYFTTKQAHAAGYAPSTHTYNVKAQNWRRDHRGVYHLEKYPIQDHPDLIEWSLWSSNRKGVPEGVYSHETALSLYDLSDVNPGKLHMTVPPHFRRSAPIPGILILHRGVLGKDEIAAQHGFRSTTPFKAITDLLIERSVSMDHMAQAVKQAFQRGLVTRTQLETSRIPTEMKREIENLRDLRWG